MRSNFKIKTIVRTKPYHSDPPGLWIGVTLVSIAFHLWLLWALRLVVLSEKAGNIEETVIPIEMIAIAPEKPQPQPIPTPNQDRPQNSSSIVPPAPPSPQKQQVIPQKTSQPQKPPSVPKKNISSPKNSSTKTPTPKPKTPTPSPPTPKPSPLQTPKPTPSPPTPKPPPPQTPKPTPSPPQPPMQSSLLEPPPKPLTPTPNPSPVASPSPSNGDRFIATLGVPQLTQPDRDIPDRLARRKQNEKQFNAIDYLIPLDLELKGEFAIEVVASIESDGTPIVYPQSIKVLAGNISPEKAAELAKKIIEQWQFEPTYMGGQPIPQEYFLRLSTRSL